MNLINELYKLIYQLRLKRNDNINNDQIRYYWLRIYKI